MKQEGVRDKRFHPLHVVGIGGRFCHDGAEGAQKESRGNAEEAHLVLFSVQTRFCIVVLAVATHRVLSR